MEPEGVNAGGPVDAGRPPAEPDAREAADRDGPVPDRPDADPGGQQNGEMLSSPGSDNGVTHRGPGQELSAGEG